MMEKKTTFKSFGADLGLYFRAYLHKIKLTVQNKANNERKMWFRWNKYQTEGKRDNEENKSEKKGKTKRLR